MDARRNGTVTLLAGGDVGSGFEPVDRLAELVVPVLKQADLRFAQCESTYTTRASASQFANAHYSYRPARQASVWQTAGIDVISLASNVTMYTGPEALLDTIEIFHNMGKHVVGAGQDISEARKPAIVERNGVKIAFLAYCSILGEGDEAGHGKVGVAPMRAHTYYMRGGDAREATQPGTPQTILTVPYEEDLRALQNDVRKAKEQADVVVMSIHWGLHFIPKTICTYQPVVAHAAIDAGADLILGHHTHILKGIEVYKGKVCFYSLGNFMITTDRKHGKPSNWKKWDLYWYRVDPDYINGEYHCPVDSIKTILAKAVFSKKGVEKISFLPAFINPQAQPAVVPPDDPKFQEILEYMEWLSDQFPHSFQAEGNEIVVDTSGLQALST